MHETCLVVISEVYSDVYTIYRDCEILTIGHIGLREYSVVGEFHHRGEYRSECVG